MGNRIDIKIERVYDKLIIVVPPTYKWKSHHFSLYIFLVFYLILSITNIGASLPLGILGKSYVIFFLLSFLCDRNSLIIISQIQFILSLAILLEYTAKSASFLLILLSVAQILEVTFFTGFKNSVFRELLGITYLYIEPSKFYICKKVLFLHQADFISHTTIEQSQKILSILLSNRHSSKSYASVRLINQARFNNQSKKNPDLPYFLFYWFTNEERKALVQMLT